MKRRTRTPTFAALVLALAAALLPISAATAASPTEPQDRSAATDKCVQFAIQELDGLWTCNDGLAAWFDDSGQVRAEQVRLPQAIPASSGVARDTHAGHPATPGNAGDPVPQAVIDTYPASKSTTWYWGNGGDVLGSTRMTIAVALHNHSENVTMTAASTQAVRLTWRTKIMHHKTLASDDLIFTYPDVHGCSVATKTCQDYEDRYGDGYNVLPYQTDWKVYWEVYNTALVVDGVRYPGSPKAQSDRATCYKTVSCKFLG